MDSGAFAYFINVKAVIDKRSKRLRYSGALETAEYRGQMTKDEPINVGTGSGIAIPDLCFMIARLTGFKRSFKFDSSKPNGPSRRALETSNARECFGFEAKVDLESGLESTIESYRSTRLLLPACD
jgi:GDP-L-fucose synthase